MLILALSSSEAGLIISMLISMATIFQFTIRQTAEVENHMTSVERVIEYGNISPEAPLESDIGMTRLFCAFITLHLQSSCHIKEKSHLQLGHRRGPSHLIG